MCLAWSSAHAQNTQFLPEIDTHLTFDPYVRVYLQAKDDQEGGDSAQFRRSQAKITNLTPLGSI